jgi:XRE family transcriptional regulator, aerobic/anaerobic benzoate catabolism transcriptional regulator
MTPLEKLGQRIEFLRHERKISRHELARLSGLSLRFLADVESGHGNISISRLLDVCSALHVPVSTLISDLTKSRKAAKSDQSILSQLSSLTPGQMEELRLWLSEKLDHSRPVIAFVGLRGAGKTTIGKKVAEKLKKKFVELDERVERSAGLTLQNIFEVHGEEYYRRLEREVLVEFLAARPSAVLAAGGGIVTREDTYGLLRQHCVTFWLKADPEDHWNRVLEQDPRPMANNPNAMDQLQAILRRREPLYAMADHTIDTSSLGLSKSVKKIVDLYEKKH